jgi:hypothetical protein
VLIGACFDGGINASDTLKNENFKPHVRSFRCWNGCTERSDQTTRNAASRAVSIFTALASQPGTHYRCRARCSMTMRSMRNEAGARYRVATARHQLVVGRGSA